MLRKMVEPAWGNRLVQEITKSDVATFLDFVAEGRPRPGKEKPNNRACKLQGHKPTPIRANRMGEVLCKMFTLAVEWEWRTDNPAPEFHSRTEHVLPFCDGFNNHHIGTLRCRQEGASTPSKEPDDTTAPLRILSDSNQTQAVLTT
jgi:hypothetical protein